MKPIIKNITVYCLSLLILFSGMGITINKMVCISSGNVEISLTENKDCCAVDVSELSIKCLSYQISEKCCEYSSQKLAIDIAPTFNLTLQKIFSNAFVLINNTFFLKTDFPSRYLSVINFNNLPPPLSGTQILKNLSVFRL